jgi:hypothetical protein
MFLETGLTLAMAARLKRKLDYNIIHLRDGEPFPFLVHLINLPLRDYHCIVSRSFLKYPRYPLKTGGFSTTSEKNRFLVHINEPAP